MLFSPFTCLLLAVVVNNNKTNTTTKTTQLLTRSHAANVINTNLLPQSLYGKRIELSKNDLFGSSSSSSSTSSNADMVIYPNDPRLAYTYGEFPLSSLDIVLDAAITAAAATTKEILRADDAATTTTAASTPPTTTFVDVGSGCGRLCLYLALTRVPSWKIHGVEVSATLHQQAMKAQEQAITMELFRPTTTQQQPVVNSDSKNDDLLSPTTNLSFHCGLVQDYKDIMKTANILFCYSTALESNGHFDPKVGGMLLSRSWNQLFTDVCDTGSIVITTDRVLDTRLGGGWKLLKRLDNIPNPEVLGSTCFIQQRI